MVNVMSGLEGRQIEPESESTNNKKTLEVIVERMNKLVAEAQEYHKQIARDTALIDRLKPYILSLKASPGRTILPESIAYQNFRTSCEEREKANIAEIFIHDELAAMFATLREADINIYLSDGHVYKLGENNQSVLRKRNLVGTLKSVEKRVDNVEARISSEIHNRSKEIQSKVWAAAHGLAGDKPFQMWSNIYTNRHAEKINQAQNKIQRLLKEKGWHKEKESDGIKNGVKTKTIRFGLQNDEVDRILVIEMSGYPPQYTLNLDTGPLSVKPNHNLVSLNEEQFFQALERIPSN